LNYIGRESATGVMAWGGLKRPDGKPATTPKEARLALRQRFREEAQRGGKVGRRIATTGIVSLPNTWTEQTVRTAVTKLVHELAPEGSEASAIVIQHIDKSNNAHLHFIAVDGVESHEAAIERTGKKTSAQRVRQQNIQRFNERGAPKRWRSRIAAILNEAAEKNDEAKVEWRSFKDRGLKRNPTQHDSPQKRARSKTKGLTGALKGFFTSGEAENMLDTLCGMGESVVKDAISLDDNGRERGLRE
jgi:hypothetical protein